MKIAIVCYPTVGGSGIVATELAYNLASFGNIVHLVSYSPPFRFNKYNENIFFHNVPITNYPLFEFPMYTISIAAKLAEIVESENIEIIHCHYAIPHTISGIIAKEIVNKFSKVKVVTTLHGTDVTLVGKQENFRKIVQYALNKTDAITCVSEFLYQSTIREFSPNKPIEVIPNFVDTNEYKRQSNPKLRRRFADDEEKIIIHISNFRKVKRVPDVVQTFSLIQKQIPSRLILVGDGPDFSEIENLIIKLNLKDKVWLLGEQTSIVELLSISDLFILTSETEGFGLAALEAMSCEVPVVCYNVGGLSEFVFYGINGFLVPLGNIELLANKSIELLRNDTLRQIFGINARKTVVENFDSRIITEKYLNLYLSLINGSIL
ncbi:N-acetyl-alpha-D-glucosaminyl L-malate synthase BshA [Bacteroidetes/Chlorobi group bacterium MS-B_bin-24]|nr:MAG: N-acetyl-alpha-D-glucosaminyl L-malate synthase BshA [Bacteroidetes/Chlorobi group bacterium MS-B_bin-24]